MVVAAARVDETYVRATVGREAAVSHMHGIHILAQLQHNTHSGTGVQSVKGCYQVVLIIKTAPPP
eukprot:COSAG06_NODE_29611_length_553_cov_0.988987_1_plen_64_part_10